MQMKLQAEEFHDQTWVTRKGIHVDRMGSAWLIRHFIDPGARFKFVPAKGYQPEPAELRFDMYEAEFTHEGDLCTFEVLLERFALKDPALKSIAEIIHDIDLKDSKFAREETIGIDRLIAGIAMGIKTMKDAWRARPTCLMIYTSILSGSWTEPLTSENPESWRPMAVCLLGSRRIYAGPGRGGRNDSLAMEL